MSTSIDSRVALVRKHFRDSTDGPVQLANHFNMTTVELGQWLSDYPCPGWEFHGACAGTDTPELWTPVNPGQAYKCRRICRSQCPVVFQCLGFALREGMTGSVWGGFSGDDRKLFRDKENEQ